MNLCPRKSVGAVIKDDIGRYLCLFRRGKGPDDPTRGWAFVAGHLDFLDGDKILELSHPALVREVREEVRLEVVSAELLVHQTYANPCSKGYDGHEWFVYDVKIWKGNPHNMEPDKHSAVRFLTSNEIRNFARLNKCDPAWSDFIWPALGII